jgi:ABC-2 type transport system ATP-binding protein
MTAPARSASERQAATVAAGPAGAGAAAGDEAIRLEGVTRMFSGVTALRDFSMSLPRGAIVGVIGPSGAGKTTAIRLLTGALAPTRGTVRVLGEDPRHFRRQTRERIGYMPQLFTLYPDLTASENVNFMGSLFGLLWLRRRRRVREVLHTVDLYEARKRRASDMSGGMQRRLELACALVHEPSLLFLDEPTAGIDPLLRARIWTELHRLKGAGRTLIVTTQYVTEAEECDLVALIAGGQLIALAQPEELRRQATGGDIIEIETAGAFDVGVLKQLPHVSAVDQRGPRTVRVTVDDAGAATPDVVTAVTEAGGDVLSAREYRLSFDEVFAELVGRQRAAGGGQSGEAAGTAQSEPPREQEPAPETEAEPTDRAPGSRRRGRGVGR